MTPAQNSVSIMMNLGGSADIYSWLETVTEVITQILYCGVLKLE